VSTPEIEITERADKQGLWVTDAELIRRLGVPEKKAREAIRMAEARAGFPKKQKLWGDRRYWPAVKAYFDNLYGASMGQQRGRA
jgi:hypothetical protein